MVVFMHSRSTMSSMNNRRLEEAGFIPMLIAVVLTVVFLVGFAYIRVLRAG